MVIITISLNWININNLKLIMLKNKRKLIILKKKIGI